MVHRENRRWKSVTRQSPCPICEHPDWCRVSEDGSRAACRRVAEGATKEKTDKAGAVFYLHKLVEDDWRQESSRSRTNAKAKSATAKTPTIKPADAETLDRVYRDLLSRLTLAADHRDALRHRGLNDDDIARGQYVTLPKSGRTKLCNELFQIHGEALLSVPGFARRNGQGGQTYLTLLVVHQLWIDELGHFVG